MANRPEHLDRNPASTRRPGDTVLGDGECLPEGCDLVLADGADLGMPPLIPTTSDIPACAPIEFPPRAGEDGRQCHLAAGAVDAGPPRLGCTGPTAPPVAATTGPEHSPSQGRHPAPPRFVGSRVLIVEIIR